MTEIYGCSESEKKILEICPSAVERFEDVDVIHQDSNNKLKKEETDFFDNLPHKISEEADILNKIRINEKITTQEFDKKIRDIKNKVKVNRQNKKWFSVISNFIQKYISNPLEVKRINLLKATALRKIDILKENQELILSELKEKPFCVFKKQQRALINKIERFNEIKNNPHYPGAYGELKILNELSKLNDEYTILCGLNIELDDWRGYGGERFNLKSAQMDFVVVSYKGVFLIEVKNWNTDYYDKNENISPYEQLDRAGRVLYNFLKSRLKYDVAIQRRINKILIPIKNNIPYNSDYPAVLISTVSKINQFISNRRDILSDYEVEQIIEVLKPFVTNK